MFKRLTFFCALLASFVAPFIVFADSSDSLNVSLIVTCPGGICLTQGCTDPKANNFNPNAGFDDGSCKYDPPPTNIVGCMDPLAINYNPKATVNANCRYEVPNVNNFSATKSGDNNVRLSWSRPGSYTRFQSVVIVRAIGRVPTGINSGTVVYEGNGSTFTDQNLSYNVQYHYLAIVKSIDNEYSSGSLADITLSEPVVPPPPPPPPPTVGPGISGGGGSGWRIVSTTSPFEKLPVTISTTTEKKLAQIPQLFVLKQPGERTKPFYEGGYLKIKGAKPFTVSVDYYKMPEVLKTIGMTLVDIKTGESFSFLLKLNADKTAYEATVAPLPQDGVFSASIYLINYEDQTIKKYQGQIAVVGSLGILGAGTEKFVREVAGPVAVTGGAVAGILQLLFAGGRAGSSLSELYLLFLRQVGAILGYLGFKKKNKPWGTVYDSITKRPIDPAYVSVFSNGEEIATAITDIDGRYGFSLLDGNYTLVANKTHYKFPSQIMAGQTEDVMFGNLYFGEIIHVGAGEVISKNIPLDPIGFDWNEFVKGQSSFSQIYKQHELLRVRIMNFIYNLGFFASIIYLIFKPSILNILVPAIYLSIYIGSKVSNKHHRVVTVKNSITGEPVPFAIIHAFYADIDQEVKKVVTDMIGRFYLLLRPGKYYLTVDHKQPDGSYARIHKTQPIELKNGVWVKDLSV